MTTINLVPLDMVTRDVKEYKMGFLEVLTLIFVILKLFGLIQWSWWAVFSPVIVSIFIGVVVGIFAISKL